MTSGGFVVAWQSLLQDGDLAGVYARVFDAGAGGSEISVNTNTTGNQVNAYVTLGWWVCYRLGRFCTAARTGLRAVVYGGW